MTTPRGAAPAPPVPAERRQGRLRPAARRSRAGVARALDRVETLLDPAVRPAVAALQRRRGGPGVEELLAGYRTGRYLSVGRWGRFTWLDPARRAIVPLVERRVPRNVARALRGGAFQVTFDRAFPDVLAHCASARGRDTCGRSWLTPEVQRTYLVLHRLGHAHSVEVWQQGRLVGGELGVAVGGYYSGESTFFLVGGAGKIAVARLGEHLHERGFRLFDTQVLTPVMEQFGAYHVPRAEFRRLLGEALATSVTFLDRAGVTRV
ncbi:MAG TPA: leucyl/phenylalanyl-tRNA--protein transferase [Pseudonocardia sp.]|nr:leucyl/phenylalanyl-tRNA--protein transferase [Pseudonocardia sp.]